MSIDYRIAPVYRLQDAVQDVEDACRWVAREAGVTFPGDGARLAVMGESAGAYLSLVAGQDRELAPRCIVSLWGYGDITGRWYSEPSSYFLKWKQVNREEAFVKGGVDLYVYARQTGSWTEIVTRLDPVTQRQELLRYCPRFNVTRDYPATLLVAGTDDQDVPFEESVLMSTAFTSVGVPHELIRVSKGGHGFEETPPAAKQLIYDKVAQFIKTYCR